MAYASTLEGKSVKTISKPDKEVGTFGHSCRDCKVEPICPGTYKTAFELFGDKIIKKYE